MGYIENTKGKSSGSRIQFEKVGSIIRFHKPHPKPVLKEYQLKEIIAELKRTEVI